MDRKKVFNKKPTKFQNSHKEPFSKNKNFQKKKFTKPKKFTDKKYDISYSQEPINSEDIKMEKSTDDPEMMKIGRFWDKKILIEPKNTSNQIFISEDGEHIYSICENSIKILNFDNLSTITEIRQVRLKN